MELKFSIDLLENVKKIVMYIDGACHAVSSDHPSIANTFNNVARNLDAVVNDVNILNNLNPEPQQPPQ